MNILAFAATNSTKSINKALLTFAVKTMTNAQVNVLDINDYVMPIYSVDLEEAHGIPDAANRFLAQIAKADALLISFAEHNGNYTAAYKNLFDWASRANMKVYQAKPMVMLATSPGPGGARNVLKLASESAHYFDGNVAASLSIPSFYDNFNLETHELTNPELAEQLQSALATLTK